MGMTSRQKGKRGERECAAEVREHLGFSEARRGAQFKGTPESPDVTHDRLHIEAKRRESGNVFAWLTEAEAECGAKVPVVWSKRNRQESVLIIRTSDARRFAEAVLAVDNPTPQDSNTRRQPG